MDETQDTSHSMIEALSSRNDDAFEKGFQRFCLLYHKVIRRWCQQWFQDENEADDAAHDLLVKLHDILKKYKRQDGYRFRNWLSKVSKNIAEDIRRKKIRKRSKEISVADENVFTDSEYVGELLIDFERRDLLREALLKTVDSIGEKDRQILSEYLDETPTDIMAVNVGSTRNALYQAMHRIKQALKEELQILLSKRGLEEQDLFPE